MKLAIKIFALTGLITAAVGCGGTSETAEPAQTGEFAWPDSTAAAVATYVQIVETSYVDSIETAQAMDAAAKAELAEYQRRKGGKGGKGQGQGGKGGEGGEEGGEGEDDKWTAVTALPNHKALALLDRARLYFSPREMVTLSWFHGCAAVCVLPLALTVVAKTGEELAKHLFPAHVPAAFAWLLALAALAGAAWGVWRKLVCRLLQDPRFLKGRADFFAAVFSKKGDHISGRTFGHVAYVHHRHIHTDSATHRHPRSFENAVGAIGQKPIVAVGVPNPKHSDIRLRCSPIRPAIGDKAPWLNLFDLGNSRLPGQSGFQLNFAGI